MGNINFFNYSIPSFVNSVDPDQLALSEVTYLIRDPHCLLVM